MALKRAVFLDYASIHPGDLDASYLKVAVPHWEMRDNTPPQDVITTLADVDVAVVNKVVLDEAILSKSTRLKLVCAAATGVNNIDLIAAEKYGITVCNARGYATASVVQHVFALLLALTTKLNQYQGDVLGGAWSRSEFFCLLDHPIRELQGQTMGIVGHGELGRAVAKLAEAFGMDVLLAKRNADDARVDRLALHELLPRVDVLSLHCPLTDETSGLIGRDEMGLMKRDAVLINTARGGLVDEMALFEALNQNRIGGAALDVLEQEPPDANHPLLEADLTNLIITPHTAWASREARQRVLQEVADNIAAFKAGQPRNVVTV